jgi:hypothetical protein
MRTPSRTSMPSEHTASISPSSTARGRRKSGMVSAIIPPSRPAAS